MKVLLITDLEVKEVFEAKPVGEPLQNGKVVVKVMDPEGLYANKDFDYFTLLLEPGHYLTSVAETKLTSWYLERDEDEY